MENKLNANKILNLIVSKMYYDEMGDIRKDLDIEQITHSQESVLVELKDGRYFSIAISTSK